MSVRAYLENEGPPQNILPEGEIMEVLMQGVARGFSSGIRRLVDQHGVTGADVGAGEALDIVQHPGEHDVLGEHGVPAKILDLVVDPLVRQTSPVLEGEILHLENLARVHLAIDDVEKPLSTFVNKLVWNQVGDNEEPILLVEFPL